MTPALGRVTLKPMRTALARPLSGDRVHFVAIGGVGMAALAEVLASMGYEVSGSDLKGSRTVRRLLTLGIPVAVGPHQAEHAAGADHVIVSAAVPPHNPEVQLARERGIEIVSRAGLLGRLLDGGRGIAVAGTHGKTTTSSMVATVLEATGFEPTFVVGGDLNDVGTGAKLGSSDIVVAEADEFSGSFLELHPFAAVVTNVDRDHLDHYADIDAIDDAFVRFLSQRTGGPAVICADDAGVRRILDRIDAPIVTFGTEDADLRIERSGRAWAVRWRGDDLGEVVLRLPGAHNALNAAAAAAIAFEMGADRQPVLDALEAFTGVERRFSVRGEVAGITVVDDYAHNPRKVAATLEAAREAYPSARVVALFQPHLYSRTRHQAAEFGSAFDEADVVVVTDVYGDREQPEPGVSGRLIIEAIRRFGSGRAQVAYVPRLEEAAGFVAGLAERGDVVLTLGAGDVTTAAPRIIMLLRERGDR